MGCEHILMGACHIFYPHMHTRRATPHHIGEKGMEAREHTCGFNNPKGLPHSGSQAD